MITLPHVHPFRYVTTIVMIVSSLATGIGTSSAQAGTDALVATTTLELEAGEMTWQAVVASTISESEPPVPIEPGFVAALDDPLLLLFEAGARLERVPADAAFAVPEPLEGHPVAMLADAPIPYLGVDLGEFDGGTADPESAPFPVEAGEYELTLWRLDPALPLAPEYIERLGALELPMLAYVREGAVDVPSTTGADPERLETGDWTVLAPGVTLAPVDGQAPPVLLLATLDQPQAEASDGPTVSQPQGGTTRQPPTVRTPTQQATTAPTQPTTPPTAAATEAPVPTVVPTDVPAPDTSEGEFDPGGVDVEQNCEDFFADSDGDGITDECEIEQGTDPNVPNSGDTGQGGSAATSSGCASSLVILCFEDGPILSRSSGAASDAAVSAISVIDEVSLACDATLADGDGDGLVDACEADYGTDPAKPDSDGDTLNDGDEVHTHRSDPMKTNTDGDGLSDADEVNTHHTDPALADSDGDSLDDANEITQYGTNPTNPDTDRDGLDDGLDLGGGTNPLNQDFDGDGLLDGDEVNTYGTFPKEPDSDGDGLTDYEEAMTHGTSPLEQDSDADCGGDGEEVYGGTNPLSQDSDGDGTLDRVDREPANPAEASLVYEGFDWCG